MAVHLSSEVGIPERKERERRHFLDRRGTFVEEERGRKFIAHGFGDQPNWLPHGKHINIEHSDKGQLDWVSRVRYIPEMSGTPKDRDELTLPKIRCFPGRYMRTQPGRTTIYKGKQCKFINADVSPEPMYMTNRPSTKEIGHSALFGNRRKFSTVWQTRGEIPYAALGDKSYQIPEYSSDFHHRGSTRPVVRFGGSEKIKPDTFIPLQSVPMDHSNNYKCRERRRKVQEEADQVAGLDRWAPAPVLVAPTVWEDNRRLLSSTGT